MFKIEKKQQTGPTRARVARSRETGVGLIALVLASTSVLGLVSPAAASVPAASASVQSVVVANLASVKMISAGCSSGRCTIWLSKADTAAFGYGGFPPALPASVPWQLHAAYYALAYSHKWFALQYANRGWCSAFRLSVYPWETQGYFGYRC